MWPFIGGCLILVLRGPAVRDASPFAFARRIRRASRPALGWAQGDFGGG